MLFDTVTIVGVGLLGGSLGLALKEKRVARRVIGVGYREASLRRALERKAIDESHLKIEDAVGDSDWVILAASVQLIPQHGHRAAARMKAGAILSDVGSTKEHICAELDKVDRNDLAIIAMHPLAGSERRGIEAARGDLFESTTCILTPGRHSFPDAMAKVVQAWETMGARTQTLDPRDHDRLLAEASHLPHAIAAVLLNSLSEDSLPFGAGGLRDMTRIASGDPDLWSDICASNRRHLVVALDKFRNEVAKFHAALSSGDDGMVRSLLSAAKERRDHLPAARLRNRE